MPHYRNRYYDLRPMRPGWKWTAFDETGVMPVGRGEADSKGQAEAAACAAIDDSLSHQREEVT